MNQPYSGCVYAEGRPGMKPYVPCAIRVRAKTSPLSTYAAVIVPRSWRSTTSRGRIAAAATRPYANPRERGRNVLIARPVISDGAASVASRVEPHGRRETLRRRFLPRRTTARRPRLDTLRGARRGPPGGLPDRRPHAPAGRRGGRGRRAVAGACTPRRPAR